MTALERLSDPQLFTDEQEELMLVTAPSALTAATLRDAYLHGIFPWPGRDGESIPWVSPNPRAVMVFAELSPPRTVRQFLRRCTWRCTIDAAFEQVIDACARTRREGQVGTWITPEMRRAYCELHEEGGAHSVEVWEGERLVGGLYGVDPGGLFTGESMFHLEPGASRFALFHLISHLRARGAQWLDIQQMTPHMQMLGAKEIPRAMFLSRLAEAFSRGLRLFD